MNHFTVPVEDVNLHFIHERSERSDAIPLLMVHGWPASFYDFRKVVEPLVRPTDPAQPAFHLVAPSLPGFAWSSLPRKEDFSIVEMARIFNQLMVDVLGYDRYIGQGGDWGELIMHFIALNHPKHMKLVHFNSFYCPPVGRLASYVSWIRHLPAPESMIDWLSTQMLEWGLPEGELRLLRRFELFKEEGSGFSILQRTRPATIGYAIASSPLSLLAYIGEKRLAWQDPSTFDLEDLLATVSIYYLTSTFQTSVMIYQQSRPAVMKMLSDRSGVRKIQIPMAFGAFPHEIEAPPRHWLARCGHLIQYRAHDKGGHFPAVENPEALADDLRLFVQVGWKTL
ncbi:alpha/beta-hydrolase [Clavulina sp. PMI_390]|nr:alpha/beta-hydrolase [Clavulina sp. PMI_390]